MRKTFVPPAVFKTCQNTFLRFMLFLGMPPKNTPLELKSWNDMCEQRLLTY